LLQVATDTPGFTVDEDRFALGTELKPPLWLEADRAGITALLPPLDGSAEHAESKVLDICAEPNTLGRTFRDLEGA